MNFLLSPLGTEPKTAAYKLRNVKEYGGTLKKININDGT